MYHHEEALDGPASVDTETEPSDALLILPTKPDAFCPFTPEFKAAI